MSSETKELPRVLDPTAATLNLAWAVPSRLRFIHGKFGGSVGHAQQALNPLVAVTLATQMMGSATQPDLLEATGSGRGLKNRYKPRSRGSCPRFDAVL